MYNKSSQKHNPLFSSKNQLQVLTTHDHYQAGHKKNKHTVYTHTHIYVRAHMCVFLVVSLMMTMLGQKHVAYMVVF